MAVQEELFPGDAAVPFGPAEVALASRLSKPLHAPGARERLAVAACALASGGAMWTLNPRDFHDIPELRLI